MSKGKEFISQLKLHTDYLKWDENLGRYETWEEAYDKVLETHIMRYGERIRPYIDEVKQSTYDREFLSSQRNLQFRGNLILKNNTKLYNCAVTYAYSPDVFDKGFFVLLSGTGLGVSLKNKFVSQLPPIYARNKGVKSFVIPDSIEGWAEASKVLISSYVQHPSLYDEYFGYQIKFDYSLIRPKGALISGGFKAPGHEGLKQSLERIEDLLNSELGSSYSIPFRSIIVYDIFMHLSDAVLSGGVRRSAMDIIMDEDDEELMNAKMGNWRQTHPWRARSNNSVGLIRHQFDKQEFERLVALNAGDNDLGFVFMSHEDEMFNPCFEIGFNFYAVIKDLNETVIQFCNLNEINASAAVDSKGRFSKEKFLELCRKAAIVGTFQAGYTSFPYLGKQTEEIVAGEALLGISITGWMTRPELFDEELLREGARVVKATNREVADFIGINYAARTTTVKPSGNASVILKTASGIHPEHSELYFRIMQINKESDTAQYLLANMPDVLEESRWSASNTDYVAYIPIENPKGSLYKSEMQGVKHLKLIELVQNSWVAEGKTEELCYMPATNHNVSNTVIIDDQQEIVDYIFDRQDNFAAVSFVSGDVDKDYAQAPNTSVLTGDQLIEKYGNGVIFMSGLIVDGLEYFDGDLWNAASHVADKSLPIIGTRTQVMLRKDWIRRVKKFAKNYFKNDLANTIYCMKDVHLWHRWNVINRSFKPVNFAEILSKPEFTDINTTAGMACSGKDGGCEVTFGANV